MSDGSFDAQFTHAPFNINLKLTVSKQGYKTNESVFTASDAAYMREKGKEYKIVLEKE